MLRILPVQLKYVICIINKKLNQPKPSLLLEWLLSTIFSPLLLQPDDWYSVLCNPVMIFKIKIIFNPLLPHYYNYVLNMIILHLIKH